MDHDRETERWRGSTDARLVATEAALKDLWAWKREHEDDAETAKKEIFGRITILETKIAGFAAIGAFGGGVVALLTQWLLGKI